MDLSRGQYLSCCSSVFLSFSFFETVLCSHWKLITFFVVFGKKIFVQQLASNPHNEAVQIKHIPPCLPLLSCVCVRCILYYVCGLSPCTCVRVGVVKVLFDSLICCVLPSSLLLCLQSSVASHLLFRFKVHSSAGQQILNPFFFFWLGSKK